MGKISSDTEKKEIITTICSQIAIILKIPVENINLNSILVTDLEADSIDILDILIRLEDIYKIKIDMTALPVELKVSRPTMTVNDIVNIIESIRSKVDN
jgi:acyl carrier protein